MADLEYQLGGLKINPDSLSFSGNDSYDAGHKFLVKAENNIVSIYVAPAGEHWEVRDKFNLTNKGLVGGGSFYLNGEERLVLDNFSGDYYAIPNLVAQRCAELILPKLKILKVMPKGILTNTDEDMLHTFWTRK